MRRALAEEHRKLTILYKHRGLQHSSQDKRLHFVVNSAAEMFNKEVRKVAFLKRIAISIYDGILAFGPTTV